MLDRVILYISINLTEHIEEKMNSNWNVIKNNENECLEFAAVHEHFAWRKHAASRFGVLKNPKDGENKYASDSLYRAFSSNKDSIQKLFSEEGNRTYKKNPEYGLPIYAVVWYESENWAILCNKDYAVLCSSEEIKKFKRAKDNNDVENKKDVLETINYLWNSSVEENKISLSKIVEIIKQNTI
ncbi:hypothetical protein ACKC9G_06045 [Pokkaliibacter sp. CJK22405]|uniref:hypothetical protein n=1 Tax=Pokkaliibacter sp. CJK22405 TaxID=3384615 RepID=UPI003984AA6D